MSYEVEQIARETKAVFHQKIEDRVAPLAARLDELEQKTDRYRGAPSGPYIEPTAGQQFVESEALKSLSENLHAGRRVGMEVKTITSSTADAAGSAGDLVVPYRDAVLPLARRPLTLRQLLPVVQVSTGSVEYIRQKLFTNSAATVAEGALKPESDLQYEPVTVPIRTIAHWVIGSRQVLDDAPQLRGLIDSELRYGLQYVEDNQLLNGAGTGTDLHGIYAQATSFAAGSLTITSPNKIDVLLAAILQNQLANVPVTGIVLHPSDWTSVVATKDAAGNYLISDPQAATTPNLFGVPVAQSQAMTAGTFLVGDFQGSATLYDRWQARVEISTEDRDNFIRNLITILAEERIGLAVKRPGAFVKGTFAAAVTDLTS